jgi:hypothetical protein
MEQPQCKLAQALVLEEMTRFQLAKALDQLA